MANFPLLQTGAVTQYPAAVTYSESVAIVRFLDATDQRWRSQGKPLRAWRIDLALLGEVEIRSIDAFFESQSGGYSTFVFQDPFSGHAVPNCRMSSSSLTTEYDATNSGSTSLWIVETNG